jgi:hypothetical protein
MINFLKDSPSTLRINRMNETCDECGTEVEVLDAVFTGTSFLCEACHHRTARSVIQIENRLRLDWRRFQSAMREIERDAARSSGVLAHTFAV